MAASRMSRMSRFISRSKSTFNFTKYELPDKYKGGKIEKMYDYLYIMYSDYKTVLVETKLEMVKHPFKALVYMSGIGLIITLMKTNPDQQSFDDNLLKNKHDLLLINETIRNPYSDSFMQTTLRLRDEGKLRFLDLLLLSIVFRSDHSKGVDLYEAQCEHLKPKWMEYRERIIDFGILGKWIFLNKSMVDFDINSNEWNEADKSNV